MSLPDNEIAEGYLANLRVVIEQYHTKKAESKNFHWLKTYRLLDGRKLDIQMGDILQLMMKNDFKNAVSIRSRIGGLISVCLQSRNPKN